MKRINYAMVTAIVISVILIAIMLAFSVLVLRKDVENVYKDGMTANLSGYIDVLKRNADFISNNMYTIQEDMHENMGNSVYYNNYAFMGRYYFDNNTASNPTLTIQSSLDDGFMQYPGDKKLKSGFESNRLIFCESADLFGEDALAINENIIITSVEQKEMPQDYLTAYDNYYYFIGQTHEQFFKGIEEYSIKSISFVTENLTTLYGNAVINDLKLDKNKVDLQYSNSNGLKLVMETNVFSGSIKYIVNHDIDFSKLSYYNNTVLTVLSCFALMYFFFFAFYILNFWTKKKRMSFIKENVIEKQNIYSIKVDEFGNITHKNNNFKQQFDLQNILEDGLWQKYFSSIEDMGTIVLKLKNRNGHFENISFLVRKEKSKAINMYGTEKNNIREYIEQEIEYGAMENSSLSIYNYERLKEIYLSPNHKDAKLFALIKISNFEKYEMLYGKEAVNEVKIQFLNKMNKMLSPYGIIYGSEIGTEYYFLITNKNKAREFINKVRDIFEELNKTIELNYQSYEMCVLGGMVIIDDTLKDKPLDILLQMAGKALIKAQIDSKINYAIYYENGQEHLSGVLSREKMLDIFNGNGIGLKFYPIWGRKSGQIDAYRVKYDLRTVLGKFNYEEFLLCVDTYGLLKEFSRNILTNIITLYKGFEKNAKRPKFFLSMPLTHFLLLDFNELSIITKDPNYETGSFVIVFNDMIKNLGGDILRKKVDVVKSLGFGVGFLSEELVVLSSKYFSEKLVQYFLISKQMYGIISKDGMGTTLISSLVEYFQSGGVDIIAGYHSEEELQFLKSIGVEYIQAGEEKDVMDMEQVWAHKIKEGNNE